MVNGQDCLSFHNMINLSDIALVTTMIKNKRQKQLKDYGIQVRNKIQNNTGVSEKWKKETTAGNFEAFLYKPTGSWKIDMGR